MLPIPTDYPALLQAVKQRVREAQYRALQQVNQQQIQFYWDLGLLIAERQQQHGWGKSVVETLARDLQTEFVGMSEFSVSSLWHMRQFYLEYSADEFLQPLVGEIRRAKHLLIMSKCKNPQERPLQSRPTYSVVPTTNSYAANLATRPTTTHCGPRNAGSSKEATSSAGRFSGAKRYCRDTLSTVSSPLPSKKPQPRERPGL